MSVNFLENNEQFSKSFDAISESDFYKGLTPELGYQHKLGHIQKVILFSKIIAQNENLNEQQTKILLVSAAFHDSGRLQDKDNGEHRELCAEIAGKYLKENFPDELVVENDNAKTLQLLRHNYKVKNRGIRKEEKDIPMKIVKLLFKYVFENIKIEESRNKDCNKIAEDTLEL